MKIVLLDSAKEHLIQGFQFYEEREKGVGNYFLDSLYADLASLSATGGVHPVIFGFRRSLSRRFPFAIYYRVIGDTIWVYAMLDCRRNPRRNRKELGKL